MLCQSQHLSLWVSATFPTSTVTIWRREGSFSCLSFSVRLFSCYVQYMPGVCAPHNNRPSGISSVLISFVSEINGIFILKAVSYIRNEGGTLRMLYFQHYSILFFIPHPSTKLSVLLILCCRKIISCTNWNALFLLALWAQAKCHLVPLQLQTTPQLNSPTLCKSHQ